MMTARRLAVLLGLSACAHALAVRPRLLRWGATEEVRRPYPGSEFVPGGERSATMAVTIGAPPSQVWPWLVQMGCDRAGWYSWDRLDNGGVPSSEHIRPQWQKLSVSDHLASTPNGSAWFEVAALEPGRFLPLRAPLDLERLRLRYCVTRHLRLFLPKYKSADDDSVFVRALESPRVQRSVEPLPGGSTPFRVEAKQYPWWDERRVIAVATPALGSDRG